MANHKSAIKRHRQSEKRRLQNKATRSAVRTEIKKVRLAIETGELDKARELFRSAESSLQKATGKNLYHASATARKVSRLAQAIKRAEAAAS